MTTEELEIEFGKLAISQSWSPDNQPASAFDASGKPNPGLFGRLFLKKFGVKMQSVTCNDKQLRAEVGAGVSVVAVATKFATGTFVLPVAPEDAAAIVVTYGLAKFCGLEFEPDSDPE